MLQFMFKYREQLSHFVNACFVLFDFSVYGALNSSVLRMSANLTPGSSVIFISLSQECMMLFLLVTLPPLYK